MMRTRSAAMLFAAAAAASACGRSAAVHDPAPAPVVNGTSVSLPAGSEMLQQIRRGTVVSKDLPTDEIVAPGKIEANPNRVSKVVLPVSGRITAVTVKMGDTVVKGQPLVTIESPDADAAMSAYLSAEANVTQSQAALAKAQADRDRAVDLFDHNAVARKDVLTAESALAQATAALEQAKATREQALRRLDVLGLKAGNFDQHVVVRSPLSGKVLELGVVPGEFRNDTNAPLMTIADLRTVWVTSQVPESYIRFVQVGECVQIRLVAYPGDVFDGRVSRIADTVDPQTRTVKVQAEMGNADGRFRPEMYGSVQHIESTAAVPVVPAGAVVQSGDTPVVFVETAPGRFEQRRVTLGKPAGDLVRIVNGVKPGDAIVVDGAMLLQGLVGAKARG